MRPIALFSLFLVAVSYAADRSEEVEEKSWWQKAIGEVSDKVNVAAKFVKETAVPAISEKFNEASDAIQDPENHKAVKDFVVDKYETAAKFTKEEIIPAVDNGLKKAYETVAGEETTSAEPEDK